MIPKDYAPVIKEDDGGPGILSNADLTKKFLNMCQRRHDVRQAATRIGRFSEDVSSDMPMLRVSAFPP